MSKSAVSYTERHYKGHRAKKAFLMAVSNLSRARRQPIQAESNYREIAELLGVSKMSAHATAKRLIGEGHLVVIDERDKSRFIAFPRFRANKPTSHPTNAIPY